MQWDMGWVSLKTTQNNKKDYDASGNVEGYDTDGVLKLPENTKKHYDGYGTEGVWRYTGYRGQYKKYLKKQKRIMMIDKIHTA